MAVGTSEGDVWIGRVTGDQPHRLVGHEQASFEVLFSPDGRRLASQTEREVLVWALPDLDKSPLHTLPLAELLARIESFTNVEAVEDPDASSGWTLEVGPFPGWRDVPEW